MIRFCYTNHADAGIVSASSAVVTLPAANVQSMWRSKPWRSTACASEWLKFDLGSAKTVLAVILTSHNLSSAATVRVQANATDVWTSPSLDVALTWSARDILNLWGANQTYRWWRFTFEDPSNPDGYISIGRVFIGTAPAPERNFSSHTKQLVDPTAISESTDWAESFEDKTPYYAFTFGWTNVLPDEIENLVKAVGVKDYFWIIADYENVLETDGKHELTAYARLLNLPEAGYIYMKRRSLSLNIREAL